MSNPFAFVPPDIVARLAALKPYTLVILKKGEQFTSAKTSEIIQSAHLPHLFKLQDEGIICFSIPLTDPGSDIAGISLYNLSDKEEVKKYAESDPAVQAGIFTCEVWSCMGLKGDSLV